MGLRWLGLSLKEAALTGEGGAVGEWIGGSRGAQTGHEGDLRRNQHKHIQPATRCRNYLRQPDTKNGVFQIHWVF